MANRNCLPRHVLLPKILTVLAYTAVAMVLGHYLTIYLQSDIVFYVNYRKHGDTIKHGHTDKTECHKHLIIGIMTKPENEDFRNIIRKTWMDVDPGYLPFNVSYKFVSDKFVSNMDKENTIYKDIVFLNNTRPLSSSHRLFLWLRYAMINFNSWTLIAKVEESVFLCTPQIYNRLNHMESDKLLYGYRHGSDTIQSLFLVFGKKIVERIALNGFCRKSECVAKDSDQTNSDGEFLTEWLKFYDDVDVQWDNSKFKISVHSNNDLMNDDFCKHYLVQQLTSSIMMKTLWSNNKISGRVGRLEQIGPSETGTVSSTVFSGDIIRNVPAVVVERHPIAVPNTDFSIKCKQWAVTTTIFNASKSVQNMVNRSEWCVVIVADTKSPSKAVYLRRLGTNGSNVVYLEPEDQNKLYPLLSRHISWKTFGRKNIGYVFAMDHGAEYIWDFDDDNDGVVDPKTFKTDTIVIPCSPYIHNKINPYPFFGVKEANPWPRGFPLEDILNKTYVPQFCNLNRNTFQIGVIQSLANIQPDVDAVYRFVRETPFYFTAKTYDTPLMVVPRFAYTPFNAQATLWSSFAFRYMYLPISVNGRVSDIWRSYFAEYFMYKQNRLVSFAPPFVNQYRNKHNILGDFNAENDIYQKSNRLIEHISRHATYDSILDLYADMYTRGYIHEKDLSVVQVWIKTLDKLNIR